MSHRTAGPAMSVLLLGAFATALASPAEASAYRFWTYWQAGPNQTDWTFATQGPATAVPVDGSVEGWSFAISSDSGAAEAAPSMPPDFADVCGGVAAVDGTKRIALIIDPGTPGIAPDGETPIDPRAECIVTEADATAYDVLRSVLEVRTDNGLVCGLGGYPARECAPILDDADVAAAASGPDDAITPGLLLDTPGSALNAGTGGEAPEGEASGSTGSPVASLAVILVLAIGALQYVWLRRRRRS